MIFVWGVLEDRPLLPGHIMIIPNYFKHFKPKEPKESLQTITEADMEGLGKGIVRCTKIIKDSNPKVKDVYLIRLVSKQWVHFHLIPVTNENDFMNHACTFCNIYDGNKSKFENGYWYLAALEKKANERKNEYHYKKHGRKKWEEYLNMIINESNLKELIEKKMGELWNHSFNYNR